MNEAWDRSEAKPNILEPTLTRVRILDRYIEDEK